MMKHISMLAAAAVLSLGTAASAATINFTSTGTGAAGSTGIGTGTYSSSASTAGFLNNGAPSVTVSTFGLGVNGRPDTNPGQIDGFPLFSSETLTITFSWAVKLINFTLGRVDGNDDFEVAYDGGSFTHVNPGFANPFGVNQNVTSLSIRASGVLGLQDLLGNDDFTLASANVASVPVPAAGLMLLAGLGGLAALRRRKTV